MTATSNALDVLVSEVGPRDGLQSIRRAMPTAVKHKWIRRLAAAGLKEIEVASFVPPRLLPQMADAARGRAGGDEDSRHSRCSRWCPTCAASRTRSRPGRPRSPSPCPPPKRTSHEQHPHDVRRGDRGGPRKRSWRSATACPGAAAAHRGRHLHRVRLHIQGDVAEDFAIEMAVQLAQAGADTVGTLRFGGLRQPGAGEAHVHAPRRRARRQGRRRPPAQHARPGTRQRGRGARRGRHHLRRLARRHRRLPVRAGRDRQHRHRGPGVPARERWACAPASTWRSLLRRTQVPRRGDSRASRSTATCRDAGVPKEFRAARSDQVPNERHAATRGRSRRRVRRTW